MFGKKLVVGFVAAAAVLPISVKQSRATVLVPGELVDGDLVFRELRSNSVPLVWDHVGFALYVFEGRDMGLSPRVWESHGGYDEGWYVVDEGMQGSNPSKDYSKYINRISGVQQQHSYDTFVWDSRSAYESPVKEIRGAWVSDLFGKPLAEKMVEYMDQQRSEGAGYSWLGIVAEGANIVLDIPAPALQKGLLNQYTCNGLIEAAAEYAGLNLGQGFIPNLVETYAPLGLTPSTLYWFAKYHELHGEWANANDVIGVLGMLFDPVAFIITDPLGRKFGHAEGVTYNEIPDAYRVQDGDYDLAYILNKLPGDYTIELFGLGEDYDLHVTAINPDSSVQEWQYSGYLGAGETSQISLNSIPEPSTFLTWGGVFGMGLIGCVRRKRRNR